MVPYLQDDIRIHPTAYIAPSARIYGKVSIGAYSSIWDGVVIRGDMAAIDIGEFSSIQENAVIHVDLDIATRIG
ncbi:MAG: gamma carbonic anhydrase family protein, partial [Calditrichia bacterium]|nr:gamma carbonic anhydrase family protein [Calditrichia bacterium]